MALWHRSVFLQARRGLWTCLAERRRPLLLVGSSPFPDMMRRLGLPCVSLGHHTLVVCNVQLVVSPARLVVLSALVVRSDTGYIRAHLGAAFVSVAASGYWSFVRLFAVLLPR